MFNIFYSFCQLVHIASGFLVTFITIPINLISRKGSSFHKIIGKLSLGLVIALVISSLLMLINPEFPNRFAQVAIKHHWTGFFKNNFYEPLFFLWLDFYALYLIISAIRIWIRIAMVKEHKKHYNTLDIIFIIVLFVFSIFFIITGAIDLKQHHPFAPILIVEGVKMMLLVILDSITLLQSGKWLLKFGWILHGGKMLFLWHGLITAFIVRFSMKELNKFSILIQTIYLLIALTLFFSYYKSRQIKIINLDS